MSDPVVLLQELGFGEYEARAYQSLLQHHPVSGYELAKTSKIPRANIYLVLQKLEERGAVVRVEGEDSTHYVPVAPEELLDAMTHRFDRTVGTAKQALLALSRPAPNGYVWQVRGYDNLLAHGRTMIHSATRELMVALWPDEARALANDFAEVEERSVEITTLCLASCAQECGGCRGRIFRNKVLDTEDARWLMVVPDDESVLVGEIPANGEVSTVRSRQKLLVDMTTWFIRHSIALGVMLQELGEQVEARLTPRARAMLAAVGPQGSRGWLPYMRELLASTGHTGSVPESREAE
ncbi:MAG: TrmB family transcriptional regulator [Caldilineaceae bacterium]|nr:TrmB family transcriptional regulator [Caldilineaceae bacterium]